MPEHIKIIAENRKARHDFHIVDKFEAGLVLLGTEVKSLRQGRVNLKEAHVAFAHGEAFLVGCHISPYEHAGYSGHDPTRRRRLLMHKRLILKLASKVREKGLTVVPIELRKTATEKVLRVAMTDPGDLQLIDDLQFATRCKVIPVQADRDEINLAINNNLPKEEPEPVTTQSAENPLHHGTVDLGAISSEDPRLDRLLEILKEKGILSVLDVERVKFD
jgi:SsrA-binding protein